MILEGSMIRLSPRLCRAARSLLGWQQDDLAEASGVSKSTIGAFETREEDAKLMGMNNRALVDAFERSGLAFISENGGGAGVRLAKPTGKVFKPKPGPATDLVQHMDAAINEHEAKSKP